jgi:predicted phosphodiesterase
LRYGVLSDIHGNMHALEATLDALADMEVSGYLCAGDLVGYGPMPNECVAAVAAIDARCVAGNHDLIAIGQLPDDDCSWLAQITLRWTREHLDPAARCYLERLARVAATDDGVVIAHGSLRDPWEYVRAPGQRIDQLHALERDHPAAGVLVLGHTHLPAAHSVRRGEIEVQGGTTIALGAGDRYLVNPGSVGQSRDGSPRARFLVLDTELGLASFHAIRYDVRGCRRALRRRGLPRYAYRRSPPPLLRLAGRLRRAARRIRRGLTGGA